MFISPAFAQETAAATEAAAQQPGLFMSMLPLLLILVIFYAMVIRPQNRRMTEHRAMLKALAKGDRIVTAGGILGRITQLPNDEDAVVEIAPGVEVSVLRHTIMMKTDALGTPSVSKK